MHIGGYILAKLQIDNSILDKTKKTDSSLCRLQFKDYLREHEHHVRLMWICTFWGNHSSIVVLSLALPAEGSDVWFLI